MLSPAPLGHPGRRGREKTLPALASAAQAHAPRLGPGLSLESRGEGLPGGGEGILCKFVNKA